jgi:hypothetical protein
VNQQEEALDLGYEGSPAVLICSVADQMPIQSNIGKRGSLKREKPKNLEVFFVF